MMAAPGGFIPGPLGWLLQAAGGGMGEAMRQPLMGEKFDVGRVGRSAATHGALGVAGSAISKPLSMIGEKTLATAAGALPKAKMQIAKALGRTDKSVQGPVSGNIGKVMARERVGVREKDWNRLKDEVGALKQKADLIADNAGKAGFRFTIDDFKAPLDKMRKELKWEFDSTPELRQFDEIVQRWDKTFKNKVLTPKQVLTLRRKWDKTAQKVYERAQSGMGGPERGPLRAEAAAAAATGARKALSGMYPYGRELEPVLQRQAELIPLRDVVLRSLLMNSGASPPFLSPVGAQMFMPQALRSRSLLSSVGLGMTDPMVLGGARNLPRGAAQAMGMPETIESLFNSGEMPDSLNRR